MESKNLILVGGQSASGKTTFINGINNVVFYPSLYRRLDAFSDAAALKGVSEEDKFKYVKYYEADFAFVKHCNENPLTISDVHFALERKKDFASDEGVGYVPTFTDRFIDLLLDSNIDVTAILLYCSPEEVYRRALGRFNRGEREMRFGSIEDARIQAEMERYYFEELVSKYNFPSLELDTEHNKVDELVDIFSNSPQTKKLVYKK